MKRIFRTQPEQRHLVSIRDTSLLSLTQEQMRFNNRNFRFRILLVVLTTLSGLALFLIGLNGTFFPNPEFFTISLFLVALIAFITACMALIKYYTRRNNKYLLVGIGFAGVAILNSVYAITSTQTFLSVQTITSPFKLYDQSWIISQFILATFIIGSLIMSGYDYRKRNQTYVDNRTVKPHVGVLTGLIILNALIVVMIRFIPIAGFSFATLVLFILGISGYLQKDLWRWKYFEFWFIIALIINIWSVAMFTFSDYDTLYFLAFFLRSLSYGIVLMGLLMSMYNAFVEVEEGKDKIDTVLRSIGESVIVLDLTGSIVLMNDAAEQLSEVKFENATGKSYRDIFTFYYEDSPTRQYPDFLNKILKEEEPSLLERVIIKRPSSQITPITIIGAPIRSSGNVKVGVVLSIRDITRERELEQTKDNFLSIAAHQLRTPLGGMRWNLEMLTNGDAGKLKKEVQDIIGQIYQNNQRMIQLVNDLLDVSRIDQNRVKDKPEEVNLKSFVMMVFKELKTQAFRQDITLHLDYKLPTNTTIRVDKNRLHDVFDNLLSNAIKYNRRGGLVNVLIRDHRPHVEISILDTGMGIPDNEQKQIFSKFFRAGNARSSVADGSGLGLFVVKSYVDAWGGRVTFSSTEGKGSVFTLFIPYKPQHHVLDKNLVAKPHTSSNI